MAGPVRIICPVPWVPWEWESRQTHRALALPGRPRASPREGRTRRGPPGTTPRVSDRRWRSFVAVKPPARASCSASRRWGFAYKKNRGNLSTTFRSRLADWTGCRRRSSGCRAKEAVRASGLHGPSRVPVARTPLRARSFARPSLERDREDVSSPAASPPRDVASLSRTEPPASDSAPLLGQPSPLKVRKRRTGWCPGRGSPTTHRKRAVRPPRRARATT